MTKFYCTTCCKIFDDKDIKWWNNAQVCERCYQKYKKYQSNLFKVSGDLSHKHQNDTGYPKNRG